MTDIRIAEKDVGRWASIAGERVLIVQWCGYAREGLAFCPASAELVGITSERLTSIGERLDVKDD